MMLDFITAFEHRMHLLASTAALKNAEAFWAATVVELVNLPPISEQALRVLVGKLSKADPAPDVLANT
jgi:hypothetical protein